jgi:hypothetical protein
MKRRRPLLRRPALARGWAPPTQSVGRRFTSRPARSPSWRSGSAPCRRRLRPGTDSYGRTAGDAPASACIRRNRRWGCARPAPTRCGTSTPPSFACSTGHAPYLHAVIDNVSRRILAWRVADTFAPVNSVVVLLEAGRGATRSASAPVVLADAGVENVNAQVDELIATGVLRRLLAFTELKFSNSMIEAWWRSLNTNGSSSTRSRTSRRSAGWWRSTSRNTTTCFRIRRFEDRRRTRCTSAPGTRSRRT